MQSFACKKCVILPFFLSKAAKEILYLPQKSRVAGGGRELIFIYIVIFRID